MDPVRVLETFGGAARKAALVEAGLRWPDVADACRRGAIVRPHRGVYARPDAPPDVVVARIWSGEVTCVSQCRLWGLPLWQDDGKVHVAVGSHRGVARFDARNRQSLVLHLDGGTRPLVPRAWEALDVLGRCVTPLAHLVAVDAALAARLIDMTDIARFRVTSARRKALLMLHADAGAGSPAETLARVALRSRGLTVDTQAHIDGVGRVDFLVDGRLVVEVDGWAFHRNKAEFAKDRLRDRRSLVAGLPTARFTASEVLRDPFTFSSNVLELLGALARRAA